MLRLSLPLLALFLLGACTSTTEEDTGPIEWPEGPTPWPAPRADLGLRRRARDHPAATSPAVIEASAPVERVRYWVPDAADCKPGFFAKWVDDELWVFETSTDELSAFQRSGTLTGAVAVEGAAPHARTLRGPSREVLVAYLASRDGYHAEVDGETVQVFRNGSDALDSHQKGEALANTATLEHVGPLDSTISGPDDATVRCFLCTRDGFRIEPAAKAGSVWVLQAGSDAHTAFLRNGPPAEPVRAEGAGPGGTHLLAADQETLVRYLAQRDGFELEWLNDELWVFEAGGEGLANFKREGAPEGAVLLEAAGPLGVNLRASSADVLERFAGE